MASRDVQLPPTFRATHDTDGLPGYPSVDVFGSAGSPVKAPADGVLTNVHFIPWNIEKRVGGWTAYLVTANGTYFLTHFGKVTPKSGSRITQGQVIGTIGAVPGNAWKTHIHEGLNTGKADPKAAATPPSAPTSDDTSATTSTATDQILGEDNSATIGPVVGPNSIVPNTGQGPIFNQGLPPRYQTWQLLTQLPGSSPDTMRMADLAGQENDAQP